MAKTPFATPLLMAAILAAFGLEYTQDGMAVCERWGFVPAHPSLGTAATSLFLHDPGNLAHVGGNLAFLAVFGVIVERALGSLRFLGLYGAAGLGGVALHFLVDPSSTTPLVGCSGGLFGLLALAAILRPGLLGFVGTCIGVNLAYAVLGVEGVSFGAHLGGFVVGFIVTAAMRLTGSEALEAT